MADEHKFKMLLTFPNITVDHLPTLIEAVRKGGRQLHSDAMLICGDNPPPKIIMIGEDFEPDKT